MFGLLILFLALPSYGSLGSLKDFFKVMSQKNNDFLGSKLIIEEA